MTSKTINLVVVGDGAVGKTCLIETYLKDAFPETYTPTVFEKYTGSLTVNGEHLNLRVWDTAGQNDHENIRCLTYSNVDAVILCFSVVHEISYENARCKWSEELLKYLPNVPIILVGTKVDLRGQFLASISRVISFDQGSRLAKRLLADSYVECSALAKFNVKQVFDRAIKAAIQRENTSKPVVSKSSASRKERKRSKSRPSRKHSEKHRS